MAVIRTRKVEAKDPHEKELSDAKKFLRKNCLLTGSGISFSREDGQFHSYVEIRSKQSLDKDVEWWAHNDWFSIDLSMEVAIDVVDWKITLSMGEDKFLRLMVSGLAVMKDTFKYMDECFKNMLDHLHISEDECISLMTELYMERVRAITEKSFPVAQRAYDKWLEKGTADRAKKERIASKFGEDFIKELTDGVLSFHDVYIENETQRQYNTLKMQESMRRFHVYTDAEMREKASNYANEMWKPWVTGEIYGILDILLGYDVGTCVRYDMDFDSGAMKVEGNIYGDTCKRLNFRTIFAGGYNIQRLHMRTIAHVFDA